MSELKKLRKEMEKELHAKRYEHTLSVAYTAASLAMVHEADVESALTAGMLHDCAKCFSAKKLISLCQKNNLPVSDIEMQNPTALLHAKVGSFLAHEKYGIDDEDILNAIKYHTTGRPDMSRLEKIIYIADYIEPGRTHAANLAQIRKLAYQDLDKTMFRILEDTLAYLRSVDGKIDSMTRQTYESIKAASVKSDT
ncbi:MAG: bis(5'-nucleosyl)-tetraphosphatase (symmetrical) YqeK [Bacillus sp. (in: Bacteria)]|nr:bis(5'-nucleosyl)-tetraphosphatase (symmetrical) YqeK [Bacillus sp. (in: firmicutes)]MCM1425890.1 bis(5'-nucleosyl)-tetraphosphatase (symmetrical) YqeK [Eubacterium sp.]